MEATSLFLWGRDKTVYILISSYPTLVLLLVGFTEYDDDDDDDDVDDDNDNDDDMKQLKSRYIVLFHSPSVLKQ
ncbi:hypothetical protein Hanom_Chr16g01514061 [Helianthus anomalus]